MHMIVMHRTSKPLRPYRSTSAAGSQCAVAPARMPHGARRGAARSSVAFVDQCSGAQGAVVSCLLTKGIGTGERRNECDGAARADDDAGRRLDRRAAPSGRKRVPHRHPCVWNSERAAPPATHDVREGCAGSRRRTIDAGRRGVRRRAQTAATAPATVRTPPGTTRPNRPRRTASPAVRAETCSRASDAVPGQRVVQRASRRGSSDRQLPARQGALRRSSVPARASSKAIRLGVFAVAPDERAATGSLPIANAPERKRAQEVGPFASVCTAD